MSAFSKAALLAAASLVGIGLAATAARSQSALARPTYTQAQADRGKTTFMARCASCHGDQLDNGQFAAPLRGPGFTAHWGAGGLDAPFEVMTTQMPPEDPGNLGRSTYVDLLAYILSQNDIPASETPLPGDPELLKGMAAPH
jgi:mono/diheme cytochrome c family protein